jgi:aquaporin Z
VKKYIIEFVGTFFLVLSIGLTGNPFAIGVTLMVMVYMGGHISGAHYNPAVTLALLMRKKIGTSEGLAYMVTQILGALTAALFVYLLTRQTFAPVPKEGYNILKPLFIEGAFTFALASVVLNAAVTKATAGNSFYGLAIGFTVMAGAYAGGAISGGAFNPAVGIGPSIIDTALGGHNSLASVWIYIAAPLAGGAAAAWLHSFTDGE